MKISQVDSFRAAAAYADIFDCPLTNEELILWRVGIAGRGTIPKQLTISQTRLRVSRHKRARASALKWEIAKRASGILRFVPGILLVGVTGSLAMNNADRDDDIDFFCLTTKDTLWTSRLLSTLLLDLFGMRRKPGEEKVVDKVCLNMFMAEGSFTVPKKDRNLFVAHEILQMVPLWERNGVYARFLKANEWVKKFLPNAWKQKYQVSLREDSGQASIKYQEKIHTPYLIPFFEPFVKWAQLSYMQKRRTTEVITHGVIRFHPQDARPWVERELAKRLKKLGIPLDKVFYSH